MPSIISTIGYITEANVTTPTYLSDNTAIIKGVIACNRLNHEPLFINFVAFRSNDKEDEEGPIQLINPNIVYLLHGKFVYTAIKNSNNENQQELQVNKLYYIKKNLYVAKIT